MSPQTTRHDVVIIGARCAGAATAMLLARAGHDVALIEKAEFPLTGNARFPRDTTSTHGLARGAVVQLSRWGLLGSVLDSGAPAVQQVLFATPAGQESRPVRSSAGVSLLVAPRRYLLDQLLASSAVAAGATLYDSVTATGLLRDHTGRVSGVRAHAHDGSELEFAARYVIGADGVHSRAAGWMGAATLRDGGPGQATFYTYADQADWPAYEFHIGERSMAGAFPTHGGAACVFICSDRATAGQLMVPGPDRQAAFQGLLDQVAPPLAAKVRDGRITAPLRGVIGLPNIVRQAHGPGWALVGDAGYHRDPVTGHGITDAFRDAELLTRALHLALTGEQDEASALGGYGCARDRALTDVFELTKAMCTYPGITEFVRLQKRLSRALDAEAQLLAELPLPPGVLLTAA